MVYIPKEVYLKVVDDHFMEVIRSGILPANIMLEGECDHCHCLIEAMVKECKSEYRSKFYPCPTNSCNNRIKMKEIRHEEY